MSQSGRSAFDRVHELAGNDATVQFGMVTGTDNNNNSSSETTAIAVPRSDPATKWEDPLLQNQEERQQQLHNDHSIFQSIIIFLPGVKGTLLLSK